MRADLTPYDISEVHLVWAPPIPLADPARRTHQPRRPRHVPGPRHADGNLTDRHATAARPSRPAARVILAVNRPVDLSDLVSGSTPTTIDGVTGDCGMLVMAVLRLCIPWRWLPPGRRADKTAMGLWYGSRSS
jgi:hypothetical protein